MEINPFQDLSSSLRIKKLSRSLQKGKRRKLSYEYSRIQMALDFQQHWKPKEKIDDASNSNKNSFALRIAYLPN
jgi:hypothetical protein